ncbi:MULTISPECIES: hypothetical protein [unclassified Sphingomonas]|uniref:hypothetical protein n=1 Tax=unclassified Sphingomonas TaxID=196159 RepID=UPI002269B06F|nr:MULTISPECIES: hypothetical protein [unclassified Sphingomonas]
MVIVQIAGVAAVLAGLAIIPPKQGNMLLLPLLPHRLVAAAAIRHGATIVARGRLPGSLVVRGRFAALAGPMIGDGVLVIGAPALLCGEAVPA